MSPSSVSNNSGRNEGNARERPSRQDSQKAIKILTQYERLAKKFGKQIGTRRISELNRLRDSGTISINRLPGILRCEFLLGTFDYMKLNEIRERRWRSPFSTDKFQQFWRSLFWSRHQFIVINNYYLFASSHLRSRTGCHSAKSLRNWRFSASIFSPKPVIL